MRRLGYRNTYTIILVIALITSIIINLIFTIFFIQKKNSFNNFKQNKYDFDKLEKQLLDN